MNVHRKLPRRSMLALAALMMIEGTALAQGAAPEAKAAAAENERLDTVTVTARRREETLRDVPVAVTALSGAAIERLNIKDLGDLQAQVPSLTVYAARGSNSTITTFIRGVGQADPLWGVDPGVGIYFDDVFMARPQGALLDVFDVQRIEVLRGPQGTLYGKNTIGGAIKYVSRPLSTKTEAQVGITAGNHGQLAAKGSVGLATDDGQWRLRVAGATLHRDGFGRNLVDGTPVSDQNTNATRLVIGFFPTGLPLSVQYTRDETHDNSHMRGFQRMIVSPFDPARTPVLGSRYDVMSGMPNINRTEGGGDSLHATWNLGEAWTLKYIGAWRGSDTATTIDFDGLPNKIADVRALYADSQRTHELQLAYDGGWQSGVLGIYSFDGRAGGTVLNNFFNVQFGTTNGVVNTRGRAAYADWSWRLAERFGIGAGIRFTDEEKHAVVLNQLHRTADFNQPIADLANFDKTRSTSNWAPKLSLDWKVASSTNLYASASRGFKSGGFNIRANTAAVPISSKPFEDEILDSAELGAKMQFDAGRLQLNAAVFHNRYRNVQLSVFTSYTQANGTPGFFGDFTNAGRAHVNGAELEFAWRPTKAWTLSGHVAALDATFDEYMDRGVNVADQKKFSNTPKLQAGLNIEHAAQTSMGTVRGRFGIAYRSKVYPTTDLSEAIAQPGYSLLSAGLIWERDRHWTFALQGSNLGDKVYRTDGYNIAALGVLDGFYGAPRLVTAGVTYRY